MNLQQFLVSATDRLFWQKSVVHWFVYQDEEQCPSAFFVHVRRAAQTYGGMPVEPLRVEQGLSAVYGQLQTSFLGSAWRYSLTSSALDARDAREVLAYAQNYQGPHALMLFVPSEQFQGIKGATASTSASVVQLDGQIDEALCLKLATFLGYTPSLSAQRMMRRLFKETQRMTLSSAIMVIEYTVLAGATLTAPAVTENSSTNTSIGTGSLAGTSSAGISLTSTSVASQPSVGISFLTASPKVLCASAETSSAALDFERARQEVAIEDAVLEQLRVILKPDSSLFTLSQLFFAKQPEPFYRYLATIESVYPEQFWISFWSEQLYRAFFYVTYMKKGNQGEAQKIGARLPFSFLQRDWRKHEPADLASSHAFLYELDSALKNGRGELGFDRFYNNFFK